MSPSTRQQIDRSTSVAATRDRLEQLAPAPPVVRRRVMVGAAGDPAERQADQVADTVISRLADRGAPTTDPARAPMTGSEGRIHRAPAMDPGASPASTIRKMPSSRQIKARTGKESKKGVIFGLGATKRYNTVLDAIDKYSAYLNATEISRNIAGMSKQLVVINGHLDKIAKGCEDYLAKEDPDPNVVPIFQGLLSKVPSEKILASTMGSKYANSPLAFGNPKWIMVIPEDATSGSKGMSQLEVTDSGGEGGKGANKEVKQVRNKEGQLGYFAEDDATGKYEDEDKYGNPKWLMGNYGVGGDLKLANRSVAMSRIDKLLNAGVIAKTERAVKGDKSGTFQAAAKGTAAMVALTTHPEANDDPNLARLLSRLHLIDLLCGQVDRHAGNYFIQIENGKVVGITGIDLDMAFMPKQDTGNKAAIDIKEGSHLNLKGAATDQQMDHLPGLAEFVDADLAERIMELDPEDLRAVLASLLDEQSVEGALSRLAQLKEALAVMEQEGKLLKPGQWDKLKKESLRKQDAKKGSLARQKGAGSYFGRDTK